MSQEPPLYEIWLILSHLDLERLYNSDICGSELFVLCQILCSQRLFPIILEGRKFLDGIFLVFSQTFLRGLEQLMLLCLFRHSSSSGKIRESQSDSSASDFCFAFLCWIQNSNLPEFLVNLEALLDFKATHLSWHKLTSASVIGFHPLEMSGRNSLTMCFGRCSSFSHCLLSIKCA